MTMDRAVCAIQLLLRGLVMQDGRQDGAIE